MGLIRAAGDSVVGTLAEQWKDFLTVPREIAPTAALFPAVAIKEMARGSNVAGSSAIITNGSKIIVPEGYGLLLFQDGELTGFTDEPGGYTWSSDSEYSQSLFAGDSPRRALVTQAWERFKFGGVPGAQQIALFVRLGELPNNRYGTQSEIYWDDAFFNTQVGAITHGSYSLHIVDPITFAVSFVPAPYLQGHETFDFTDHSNPASEQLFREVVGSLAAAFSRYLNDPGKRNRMTAIQQDSVGFAQALAGAVEDAYAWRETRGLVVSKVTVMGIEYDSNTKELLKTVQRADALAGGRGNSNLQASVAEGIQTAGSTAGAEGILGIGIASGSLGLTNLAQPSAPPSTTAADANASAGLMDRLATLKSALEAGLITQEDYDAAKAAALGL